MGRNPRWITHFVHLQDTIRTAARLEDAWRQKIALPEADRARYLPFMPFQLPAFDALLYEAMTEAPGDRFLDIGCGPGSKLLIAQEHYGLDAYGIDRVPEYVAAAREAGLKADVADALDWTGYGDFDLIWFYRPMADPALQAQLEWHVWNSMAPGAIVACANLESPPPFFLPVLDDWELKRGIWMKPLVVP
jgi:SAM-dependent methyltransferase